jgi:hypothetical protein
MSCQSAAPVARAHRFVLLILFLMLPAAQCRIAEKTILARLALQAGKSG